MTPPTSTTNSSALPSTQCPEDYGAALAAFQEHEERMRRLHRAKKLAQRSDCRQSIAFLIAALLTFAWIVGWMLYGMTHEAVELGQNLHR